MMERCMTRRLLLGASAGGSLALVTGRLAQAQSASAVGAIGLSQQEFESIYGRGVRRADLFIYSNPYLNDSRLSVAYHDGVATFIEASVPAGSTLTADDGRRLAQKLMSRNALPVSSCQIPSPRPDTVQFRFNDFEVPAVRMSGASVSYAQSCVMTKGSTNEVTGVTISLAIPNGADQYAPAAGSVGVGDSDEDWGNIHGRPRNASAAAGNSFADYDVPPWDGVLVGSHRAEIGQTVITLIDATSQTGLPVDDAIAFGNGILPQGAQRQAAYAAYPTTEGPQEWGTSTWWLPIGTPMLLFSMGAGDGSSNVVRVVASLAEGTNAG